MGNLERANDIMRKAVNGKELHELGSETYSALFDIAYDLACTEWNRDWWKDTWTKQMEKNVDNGWDVL